MDYTLEVITPPTKQLVSIERAKAQLRVERTEIHEDDFILDLIDEATELVEDQADITLMPKTYRLTMPRFPKRSSDSIYLPRPPLVIVNSVKYFDASGDEQSLDETQFSSGYLSSVWLDLNACWPATRRRKHAVTIEYQSGSDSPPKRARRAILLIVATWFLDREGEREIPAAAAALIDQLRPGDEFSQVDAA